MVANGKKFHPLRTGQQFDGAGQRIAVEPVARPLSSKRWQKGDSSK